MKRDWLDQKLRKKLTRYESPLDTDQAWEALADRRSDKRKRRPLVIWWLAGIGVVLLSVWWLSGMQDDTSIVPISNVELAADHPLNTNHKSDTEPGNSSDILKNQSELISSNKEKENGQVTSEPPISSSVLNQIKNKDHFRLDLYEQAAKSKSELAANEPMYHEQQKILNKPERTTRHQLPLALLPTSSGGVEAVVLPDVHQRAIPQLPQKVHKPQRSAWAVSVSAGYGLTKRSMSASDPALQSLIRRRQQSLKALDVYSLQLSVRAPIYRQWWLASGLRYQQLTDRFSDQYRSESPVVLPDQVVRVTTLLDGTQLETRGPLATTQIEEREKIHHNRITHWQLPVMVGWSSDPQAGFGWEISTGLLYGFSTNYDGLTHNDDHSLGQYQELENLTALRSTNLQYTCHLGLRQRLHQNWVLTASLQAGTDLGSRSTDYDLNYRWVQAGLGLRWQW